MLTSQPIHGGCDVIIFHPRHDLTLAQMNFSEIERIIAEWIRVYRERGSQAGIKYVQIFEVPHINRIRDVADLVPAEQGFDHGLF